MNGERKHLSRHGSPVKNRILFLLLTVLLAVALTTGCTAIGLEAGRLIDDRMTHAEPVNLDSLGVRLEKGDLVRVTLTSGVTVEGEYREYDPGRGIYVKLSSSQDEALFSEGEATRIPLAPIKEVDLLKRPKAGRIVLGTCGAAIDISLIYTIHTVKFGLNLQ